MEPFPEDPCVTPCPGINSHGRGDVFVSGLISYSLAWLERWPGEGDEPLLAQRLVKLPAISSFLFSIWQDGRSSLAQPKSGAWMGHVQSALGDTGQ